MGYSPWGCRTRVCEERLGIWLGCGSMDWCGGHGGAHVARLEFPRETGVLGDFWPRIKWDSPVRLSHEVMGPDTTNVR